VGAHYIHGGSGNHNSNSQAPNANHPSSLTPSKVGGGKGSHVLSPHHNHGHHGPLSAIHGLNGLNLNSGGSP